VPLYTQFTPKKCLIKLPPILYADCQKSLAQNIAGPQRKRGLQKIAQFQAAFDFARQAFKQTALRVESVS
jgi:hypothetical protein